MARAAKTIASCLVKRSVEALWARAKPWGADTKVAGA